MMVYVFAAVYVAYAVLLIAVVRKFKKKIRSLECDNKFLLHKNLQMHYDLQRKFVFPVETRITPYDIANSNGEYVDYVSRKIVDSFAHSVAKHYETQLLERIKDLLSRVSTESMFDIPVGETIRILIPAFRIMPEHITVTQKDKVCGKSYGTCGKLRNRMEEIDE